MLLIDWFVQVHHTPGSSQGVSLPLRAPAVCRMARQAQAWPQLGGVRRATHAQLLLQHSALDRLVALQHYAGRSVEGAVYHSTVSPQSNQWLEHDL